MHAESPPLILKNARVVDVLRGAVNEADVVVSGGVIAAVGDARAEGEIIDLQGAYVCPCFMDAHVHLESSMLHPAEFARAVLPAGTTTVFADPHEIANVLGLEGIRYLRRETEHLPLRVLITLPSCVPATPYETSGAELGAAELAELMPEPWVAGLGEMMNYVGVVQGDPAVLAKLELAKQHGKTIDGHAPGLRGKALAAYAAAGVASDHECSDPVEAREKQALGMQVMIREGTAARNLDALMPLMREGDTERLSLATDDRHPRDLRVHLNGMLQRCVAAGVDPIVAIRCATINTARYFGLKNAGAIAPGYRADIAVLPNLRDFRPSMVFCSGRLVARAGECCVPLPKPRLPHRPNSMTVAPLTKKSFLIPAEGTLVRAMRVLPGVLLTPVEEVPAVIRDGEAVSSPEADLLKIAVIERHNGSGRIGLGFIRGFGLRCGAFASTVAHDSHNLIVIGASDADMLAAAQRLIALGGGKVVVANGQVMAELPLPIAGLMSPLPLEKIIPAAAKLTAEAHNLGCTLPSPFMALSFLSLSVIPQIKLTDKGLFDTDVWDFVPLFSR